LISDTQTNDERIIFVVLDAAMGHERVRTSDPKAKKSGGHRAMTHELIVQDSPAEVLAAAMNEIDNHRAGARLRAAALADSAHRAPA
jgi:hypothetical protein